MSEESNRLREERQSILVSIDEDRGRQLKREELVNFFQEQTIELGEFDDGLVRRFIEQVTVHESGTFMVEFKSGTMVDV